MKPVEEPSGEVESPRRVNVLGIVSIAFGGLALAISWVPLLGILAWPLGGLGAILGAVGLGLALKNGRWGTISPTAGLAANLVAVLVTAVVTFWMSRALTDAADQMQVELAQTAARQAANPIGNPPTVADPGPFGVGRPEPDGTFAGQDANGDGRLNADEAPEPIRARFAELDRDADGYLDQEEWDRAAPVGSGDAPERGALMARRLFTSADDFIVDVWHNGRRVPIEKRSMVGENYGATAEKIEVEIREGDWLVFNVANNRLRWGGASYFGAAGVNDQEPLIGFTTDPDDPRWSYCDDPGQAPAFIARPDYLADQSALSPENPWGGGDGEMTTRVPGWDGRPVWGRERTTWIKFVARPGASGAGRSAPTDEAMESEAARPEPEPEPEPEGAEAPAVAIEKKATLEGHPALVYWVAVSPDGRKAASTSAANMSDRDGAGLRTLILWDLTDDGKTRTVIPIDQSVTSVAFTPDSKSVVAPVENGLTIFDASTGKATGKLEGPPQTNSMCVAVSPDGKYAAAGMFTKEILIWDLKARKPLRKLSGHTAPPSRLAFSPDGQQLASGAMGGEDTTVRIWDVATGRSARTLKPEGADSPLMALVYTADGSHLLTVNAGDAPRIWDLATGEGRAAIVEGDEIMSQQFVALSPDSRRLATTAFLPLKNKWAVALWDAATGRHLATVEDPDGQTNVVAFTPDGAGLVSGGGKTVKLWTIAPAP